MGISGAMSTAVSGLIANSTAVARISENIANSATTGYKRTFADMVTESVPGAGSVSGVSAVNGSDIEAAGMLNSTGNAQDLGISGSGFFVVSKTPNDPLLSNYFLTRAGNFREDENGFLVNKAGYYLSAYEVDPATGQVGAVDRNGFSGLTSVQIGEIQLPATPSSKASVKGNLPAQETGITPPGAPFLSSLEFFTQLGRGAKMELSWQPTDEINTWDLTLKTEDQTFGTVTVSFDNAGDTPGAPQTYALAETQPAGAEGLTVDAATGIISLVIEVNGDDMPVELSIGAPGTYDGIQQFVGDFTPQKFVVDGSAQTALARTETDEQGKIWGVFDDGRRMVLYEVPLAQVTNPNGMILQDGNAYQVTRASGSVLLNVAGTGKNGTIAAGTLEGSTVEVATELTDLIRIQRAYSSNAKIITAADEMLQEVNNLKR